MKRVLCVTAALAMAAAIPAVAEAQNNGNGNGNGKGRGASENRGGGPDHNRGNGNGNGNGNGRGGESRARPERVDIPRPDRRVEREIERRVERAERDVRPVVRDLSPVERLVVSERGLIAGCPPGLARKNNGCLPPGQARQIARSYNRYDYLWDRRDDYRYTYDNGYLYRTDRSGSLLGYLPLLGGALIPGATWPTQYQYQQAPAYYGDYYRLNDRYNYRYADGVLYGVDPQTQAIGQVAALLTGQTWNVGQAMPAGYDVYNVPYGYRDRYYDTPERMYRYNDGYVYQIDPTTQLVQAVIQLLT